MGGRGSSSGMSGISFRGITVKIDGESTDYFFATVNGTHYYQRGVDGMPQPTPQNMTMSEFKNRVLSNGAEVQTISESKRKKMEERYKKDRRYMDNWLNEQWYRAAPRPRKGWGGH